MSKHNLIVFGEDWGGIPSSTQHLIRNLPDRGKTLWFNSVGLRAPRFSAADAKRIFQKLKARTTPEFRSSEVYSQVEMLEDMTVVEPKVLPFHRLAPVRQYNANRLQSQISDFAKSCGEAPPLLWITVPTAAPILARYPDLTSIYYCCDDFETLPGVDHKLAAASERLLATEADLIVVTNPLLADKFPGDKTVYVSQGVDYDLFAQNRTKADDLPQGKIVGFFGLIADWVDQEMIADVARALAPDDWTVFIVGPANTDTAILNAEPNIKMVGPRPYNELPRYAQHWDVSILPFKDTPEVRASNPLKLREYLAAGPPVITTDFPAARPYAKQAHIVHSAAEMVSSILAADNSTNARSDRQLAVKDEGWSARAREILDALQSH